MPTKALFTLSRFSVVIVLLAISLPLHAYRCNYTEYAQIQNQYRQLSLILPDQQLYNKALEAWRVIEAKDEQFQGKRNQLEYQLRRTQTNATPPVNQPTAAPESRRSRRYGGQPVTPTIISSSDIDREIAESLAQLVPIWTSAVSDVTQDLIQKFDDLPVTNDDVWLLFRSGEALFLVEACLDGSGLLLQPFRPLRKPAQDSINELRNSVTKAFVRRQAQFDRLKATLPKLSNSELHDIRIAAVDGAKFVDIGLDAVNFLRDFEALNSNRITQANLEESIAHKDAAIQVLDAKIAFADGKTPWSRSTDSTNENPEVLRSFAGYQAKMTCNTQIYREIDFSVTIDEKSGRVWKMSGTEGTQIQISIDGGAWQNYYARLPRVGVRGELRSTRILWRFSSPIGKAQNKK